jgi:hypothetical protein
MTPLDRLFAAARSAAQQPRDDTAPFGFASRVVAQWRTQPVPSQWTPLTLRALGFAALLLLSAAALNAWPGGEPAALDPDIADAVPEVLFAP